MALSTLDFSGWTFHDAFHAASPRARLGGDFEGLRGSFRPGSWLAAGIAGAAAYTRAQGPELQ
jgi:hypothetical protein